MGWTCTNAACFVSVFDAIQSECPNCGQKAAPHGYTANRANGGKGQGGPTTRFGGFKGIDAKGTAAQKGKGKGKGGKGGPAGKGPQDPQAAIPGPNRSKKGALGRIPQKTDNTVPPTNKEKWLRDEVKRLADENKRLKQLEQAKKRAQQSQVPTAKEILTDFEGAKVSLAAPRPRGVGALVGVGGTPTPPGRSP